MFILEVFVVFVASVASVAVEALPDKAPVNNVDVTDVKPVIVVVVEPSAIDVEPSVNVAADAAAPMSESTCAAVLVTNKPAPPLTTKLPALPPAKAVIVKEVVAVPLVKVKVPPLEILLLAMLIVPAIVSPVNPANVVEVAPRDIDVEPIVIVELAK